MLQRGPSLKQISQGGTPADDDILLNYGSQLSFGINLIVDSDRCRSNPFLEM